MSLPPFPVFMKAEQSVTEVFVLLPSLSLQTGFPSRDDNPSCHYSRVDFDSDEDFNSFFNCECYEYSLPLPTIATFLYSSSGCFVASQLFVRSRERW